MRVLVAEDDLADIRLLESVWPKDWHMTVVRDGREASEQNASDYDAMVLDDSMAYYSGFEVAQKMLAAGATVPIIIWSGMFEELGRERAGRLGIEFISKNSDFTELVTALKNLTEPVIIYP